MSSYYYLMAQLPGMIPNTLSPITYAQFKETASRFLSGKDLSILETVSLEPPRARVETGSVVVDGWFSFERALRFALEHIRAPKLKRDLFSLSEDDRLLSETSEIIQVARTATGFENPFEAERFLDRSRGQFIEQLSGTHFFDSDAVFAYGLMVLLHERSDRFTAEAGRASYTTIYNKILGE